MNRFGQFIVVGLIAAVANWGSGLLFNRLFPLGAAVVLAYCIGITVAYWLNRSYVFKSTAPSGGEAARFVMVNLVSVAMVFSVTLLMAHQLLPAIGITHHVEPLAHAIGIASPTLLSYLAHSAYTFQDDQEPS